MRVLLALLLFVPAKAQTVRLGGDVVAGYHGLNETDLAFGAAGIVQVRTSAPFGAYALLRPEATVTDRGGTGFIYSQDVLYYGPDGLPVYGGGSCQSVATGQPSPGRCGTSVLGLALGGEVGARWGVGGGAVLLGVGGRVGEGGGVYGALSGRLADPAYARVEVGTGHVMVGLGFGGL